MATVYSLIAWGGRTGKTVSLSASTDVVTLTNHGLRNGTKLWPSGTLPAELNTSTPVYARSTADNTFTLHTSSAGAIANTGQITFAGSSTYAAVVLKSDLVANTASALAPYGLSDLSRWGASGSERIYDGVATWRSVRYSAAQPYDSEYCEIGESFIDISTSSIELNIPCSEAIVLSKINDIHTAGWHGGAVNAGYMLHVKDVYYSTGFNITGTRQRVIDISFYATNTDFNMVGVSGIKNTVAGCIVYSTTTGVYRGFNIAGAGLFVYNNLAVGCGVGFEFAGYSNSASVFANNLAAKNSVGFAGSSSNCYGFYYNNASVGNTTNWGTSPVVAYATCAYNGGISTDTPWYTGTDTGIKTLTADNSTFVDYSGNNFKPAGDSVAHTSSAGQVDTGVRVLDVPEIDMLGSARPDYKNGSATDWDLGPFEFDWGYVIPASTSVTFQGVVAGSEIRVFNSSGVEIAGIESCATDQVLTWTIPDPASVEIKIINFAYKIKVFPYTSSVGNQTIPVQMEADIWAYNP